jgi:hypothetical protein
MSQEHGIDPPSSLSAWRTKLLAELREQISNRLRPVCPNMPADAFEQMVDRIAAMELKYMFRSDTSQY